MCPTDDLGIEYDEDVDKVLKEPKSSVLQKFLDYRDARKAKERELDEARQKKEKPEGIFGGLFS